MKTANDFRLGHRVRIIGNEDCHTMMADGMVGNIIKKYRDYCAVREDSTYEYVWWCYYDDIEPVCRGV